METYAAIGGGLVLLGVIVWMANRWGKSAGAIQQQADSSSAALRVEKKMQEAAANAPSDIKGVEDAARRGEF